MQKIKLIGSRFSLVREDDHAGDSGPMFRPFDWKTRTHIGEDGEIIIGYGIKCGSMFARTMSMQDWWLTTPVKEILEYTDTYCKFVTESGSIYIAKVIG